jgi:hypothetical protein
MIEMQGFNLELKARKLAESALFQAPKKGNIWHFQ